MLRSGPNGRVSKHAQRFSRSNHAPKGCRTFLAPGGFGPHAMGFFDIIREEIATSLGAAPPSHWLNIEFTSDPRWL